MRKLILIIMMLPIFITAQETMTDSIISYGGGSFEGRITMDTNLIQQLDTAVDMYDAVPLFQILDSIEAGGEWLRTDGHIHPRILTDSVGIGISHPTEIFEIYGGKLTLNGTSDWYENTSGHSQFDGNSIIFNTSNIGTTLGSYNTLFGSGNFNAEENPYCNFGSGSGNAYSATGSVLYNGLIGSQNAYSATGNVSSNGLIGYRNAYSATGNVSSNGLIGSQNAYSATGDVYYNGLIGYHNAYSATGSVLYNGLIGYRNAYSATGSIYYNGLIGSQNAYSATGSIYNSLLVGQNNADSAITVTQTIAVGGQVFKNSKINLTNAIGLGYQAGINTTFTGAAIFGTQGQPTVNNQVVIGSDYYTGGILLDENVTFSGAMNVNITTINAATYDILSGDYLLHVTYTTTAAVTSLTLPTAQVISGRVIIIKDADGNAGTNNITVDTQGSETIDGQATLILNSNYQTVNIYSDGSNWFTK